MSIHLRDLTTLDDCRRVVELEKRVWAYTDAEDVVPVPILIVTVKRGGILIGAFDDQHQMVGFVYSLPGLKDGKPTQWSHMLGVIDPYRNSGIGHRLKLEQRARALAMGLDLVEWTYDPLQALNAHLNFRKLGVFVEEYEENIYGESSSPLHHGTPTDRFVAEWWIRTPHVARRIAGDADSSLPWPAVVVNRTRLKGNRLNCKDFNLSLSDSSLAVEIPMDFGEIQQHEPSLAREWRFATREMFTSYFRRGYRAIDFLLDRAQALGRYLLVNKGNQT